MTDSTPQSIFRGLPLTPEQDAEVRHYIKKKGQHGVPWDTPELDAMLRDMIELPGDDDGGLGSAVDEQRRRPQNARQLPSTRPWNPLKPAKSEMLRWKPKV
jgi:hypothetical protein